METAFWSALSLSTTMAWVTWRAHRGGTERRDVLLLGTVTGLIAVGVVLALAY
jgi:hypothetical protein